uniref:Uncharacterized protein n=1 Tax=Daphnia galeata TaxID=27404 RepID=A0A8J2RQ98_9CRUS|nr:unnamed protein product [Daphnia galeata]
MQSGKLNSLVGIKSIFFPPHISRKHRDDLSDVVTVPLENSITSGTVSYAFQTMQEKTDLRYRVNCKGKKIYESFLLYSVWPSLFSILPKINLIFLGQFRPGMKQLSLTGA